MSSKKPPLLTDVGGVLDQADSEELFIKLAQMKENGTDIYIASSLPEEILLKLFAKHNPNKHDFYTGIINCSAPKNEDEFWFFMQENFGDLPHIVFLDDDHTNIWKAKSFGVNTVLVKSFAGRILEPMHKVIEKLDTAYQAACLKMLS